MHSFFRFFIRKRKAVLFLYLFACILCVWCSGKVKTNSSLADYLPSDSDSTVALREMENEFGSAIPNVSMMVKDISFEEAAALIPVLKTISGVENVNWILAHDYLNLPTALLPKSSVKANYSDGNALYTLTLQDDASLSLLEELRTASGHDCSLSGSFVNTKVAQAKSNGEILRVIVIVVILSLGLLMLTMPSYAEPFLLLFCLLVAVLLNMGTNLLFGTISSVTKTASSVLQMGVSVDYFIFLLHRYREYKESGENSDTAMENAMCSSFVSILSSSLTTIIGFLALLFMRYGIGMDMGLVLSKGIAFSLLVSFTLLPAVILIFEPLIRKTSHPVLLKDAVILSKISKKIQLPVFLLFLVLIVPAFFMQSHNNYLFGMSRIYKENHIVSIEKKEIEEIFGRSNTMALLLPKDAPDKEKALIQDLKEDPSLVSVTSYADLSSSMFAAFLPDEVKELLQSEHYSRIVLKYDIDEESEETFRLIESIRSKTGEYYDNAYLAGTSPSTYDLKQVISADSLKVNAIAAIAIFLVLFISFRTLSIPLILTLAIEGSIWICMSISYLTGSSLFYIGYLIVSSILLGSTVDYAILVTSRYLENAENAAPKDAMTAAIRQSAFSVLTSATILSMAGVLLFFFCTNQLIAQLGLLLSRGTVIAAIVVLFALPQARSLLRRKNRTK